jgi:hypothetical protein
MEKITSYHRELMELNEIVFHALLNIEDVVDHKLIDIVLVQLIE